MNVVIGGGAAGMMAAGVIAHRGKPVILLERNDRLGKKLYITGKGRCNLTNDADVQVLLENIPGNPYFLYSALYSFDSRACAEFFHGLGVPTKTERGNRVFPVSEKASDVVKALERFINGVDVRLNTGVKALRQGELTTDAGKVIKWDSVVVATGGLSYPMTGSAGDGYRFARETGHTVTKLYPAIVPLTVAEEWVAMLQGLSLRNVAIDLKAGGRSVYRDFGEMLFTHYGVSGPVVLSASRHIIGLGELKLWIDLKPALSEQELDSRVLRDFQKYINKSFKNSLADLLPQKLIPVIVKLSGINPVKKVNEITRDERRGLVRLLKNLELSITGTAGFNEAVITSGGVCVDQIDPSTMESKLVPGLYFAGEVLDVDGYTGGFNLQIAFSTGYLAGMNVGGGYEESICGH